MKISAIRGAITVEENTEKAIETATVKLFKEILDKNAIKPQDIAYINFSATKDITAAYPAKFIRTALNITDVPMMCYQEMAVDGALDMCLRILIVINTINTDFTPTHVYLDGAKILRPDLLKD